MKRANRLLRSPPSVEATQSAHNCDSASVPAKKAAPADLAEFRLLPGTAITNIWMVASVAPIAKGAMADDDRLAVAPI